MTGNPAFMRTWLLVTSVMMSASAPALAQALEPVQDDAPRAARLLEEDPGGRFRWGLSGGVGLHLPYTAFGLNLEGRVGAQFTNHLGAYLAIGGHVGLGASYGLAGLGGQVSANAIAHFTLAALVELIVANRFWVAAGPAFGVGAVGVGGLGIAVDGGRITGVAAAGFKPGFDVRVGVGFHEPNKKWRRKGFNLGLDVLVLYHPTGAVAEARVDGNGVETTVTRAQPFFTATPLVTLGYEMR